MTDRREFGKMAVGGALGAFLAAARRGNAAVHQNAPGIKLCAQSGAAPSDEQLTFLKQIGAQYVSVGAPADMRTAEGFLQIKKRYADAGITVWNIGNTSVHNMPEVTLICPAAIRKSRSTNSTSATWGKPVSTTPPMPIWATAYGPAAAAWSAAPRRVSSTWRAPRSAVSGTARRGRSPSPTGASSPRTRSGPITLISSNRLRRWRKRPACASAFTRTIRRCLSSR